jgi:short subunit fatty acids transporter
VIEALYVLQAETLHQVHLGWVVQIYNAAEALPNLVNPFWMLALLGILRLKARDLVGYGMLQLSVHLPIVFFCFAGSSPAHWRIRLPGNEEALPGSTSQVTGEW